MIIQDFSTNDLRTRRDLVRAAVRLMQPLKELLSPGKALLPLGDECAAHNGRIADMEGFCRVLWGLIPLLAADEEAALPLWEAWRQGLINGTDPHHPEYWGTIGHKDQRMVEMAPIAAGICLAPEKCYHALTAEQQENLCRWLEQINHYDMVNNNWRFFRVLVNAAFCKVGRPWDQNRMEEDLALLDSHYAGSGWYFDLPGQFDYYSVWAFHFYSLIYAKVMAQEDPLRCETYKKQAMEAAPRFALWFDGQGRGLPYGRSLTYRFAQSAFWAALALADAKPRDMTWGHIRHLLMSNLRQWLRMPIFDRDGVLTLGYGYPHPHMSESYNAPGSPYWALKAFLILAVREDHPFWTEAEAPLAPPGLFHDATLSMLIARDGENRAVTAFPVSSPYDRHIHMQAKYQKFAYSTHFGFSVPREMTSVQSAALDSMLAFREKGRALWHPRETSDRFETSDREVKSTWSPLPGVKVETLILPLGGNWHIRCHTVYSDRPLDAAEGAFALPRDWPGGSPSRKVTPDMAAVHSVYGSSAIIGVTGYGKASVILPDPCTNLIWPRTVLPMLQAEIKPGITRLVCAVYCDPGDSLPGDVPQEAYGFDLNSSLRIRHWVINHFSRVLRKMNNGLRRLE